MSGSKEAEGEVSASRPIDARVGDWRGETLARVRALEDSAGLFDSSLEGNARRAIDLGEGDGIDEEAFKALVRAAVALNLSRGA